MFNFPWHICLRSLNGAQSLGATQSSHAFCLLCFDLWCMGDMLRILKFVGNIGVPNRGVCHICRLLRKYCLEVKSQHIICLQKRHTHLLTVSIYQSGGRKLLPILAVNYPHIFYRHGCQIWMDSNSVYFVHALSFQVLYMFHFLEYHPLHSWIRYLKSSFCMRNPYLSV